MGWDSSTFRERELHSRNILRNVPSPKAPDYLAARVKTSLRARQRSRWRELFWRAWIPASLVWTVLFAWSIIVTSQGGYEAPINRAMAIRLDTDALIRERTARTEINLPPGVNFHSERYPDINGLRTLHLKQMPQSLSFVVEGTVQGTHEIQVRYFDNENQMMMVRTVTIRFKKTT